MLAHFQNINILEKVSSEDYEKEKSIFKNQGCF
jgi:hypothetical protein